MFLNPYHKFDDGDGACFINIEDMTACRIDDATSRLLDNVSADPDFPVSPDLEEKLKTFGLPADDAPRPRREGKTEPAAIRAIALFIIQKCNFNCIYCFGGGGEYASEGKMDRETARRAVDWLIEKSQKIKKLKIAFFGGEPLLNFALIKDVVFYAEKRGEETGKEIEFGISTNGSLLDDEKIAFIKEYNIDVKVGFDGLKEAQDTQRPFKNGKGSYDATLPKIKRLLAAMPYTTVRATLLNRVDPALAEKALREIGFTRVAVDVATPSRFNRESDSGNSEWIFSRMMEMAEAEAGELFETVKARRTEKLKQLQRESFGIVNRYLGSFLNKTKKYFPCGAGREYVSVSRSGDIFACHGFVGMEEFRLGSIFDKDLKRETYQKSPIRTVDKCSSCFAKYICGGGCIYDNLITFGSIFEPNDSRCRYMQRSVELLASLSSRLSREDKDYLIEEEIIRGVPRVFDF